MYAQNNLDNIVLSFFKDTDESKVFVEAGGSHPTDQNNTYILEKNGWSGLIVEPKLDFNEHYKSIRPNSILENYVLVDFDYKSDKIEGDFKYYMMGGTINTFEFKDWNPSEYDCCTLQSLLDKHNISKIHFLSLDTEGTEKGILDGIDFDKTFIHLIIVETHVINGVQTNFDFLLNKNFEKVYEYKQHVFYLNKSSEYFNKWELR
jgi:FkbM family methyltransferase